MKLTLIQPTDVPEPLRERFGPYHLMFERLFAGEGFTFEAVRLDEGETLPEPDAIEAALIMGSYAGVYDTHHQWMAPLRDFVRGAHAARTPLVGICFGHQIIADALGGDVRKSDKGWGMGRHRYAVTAARPPFGALTEIAIACSHQDQVIAPPAGAETILASEFTPHAGLAYDNGAILTMQPHPEFTDEYARALAELRRGRAPDETVDGAVASFAQPSHSREIAGHLAAFLRRAG
jgi:GMP synthase-like glutamine amidotransferase